MSTLIVTYASFLCKWHIYIHSLSLSLSLTHTHTHTHTHIYIYIYIYDGCPLPSSFTILSMPKGYSPSSKMKSDLLSLLERILKISFSHKMALFHILLLLFVNGWMPTCLGDEWVVEVRMSDPPEALTYHPATFHLGLVKEASLLYQTNDFGRTWTNNYKKIMSSVP